MFTGLIQDVGEVVQLRGDRNGVRLRMRTRIDLSHVSLGDSIAVDGVCLTVVGVFGDCWDADASHETMRRTNLGERRVGDVVHLESALRVGDPIGGHWVLGHVDCVAKLVQRLSVGNAWDLTYELPAEYSPYIVEKGSIAVDGTSLTVNTCGPGHFGVTVIPHTGSRTHILKRHVGSAANIETDILGKYVVASFQRFQSNPSGGITMAMLGKNGYL
ncbi:MAG: riboflavin synthase [Myxococcales bacterium]|nr:riboflavin synthase [Myxococcales bacterium]